MTPQAAVRPVHFVTVGKALRLLTGGSGRYFPQHRATTAFDHNGFGELMSKLKAQWQMVRGLQ